MVQLDHMSISHRLGDMCTWKFSPYRLSLGQNFAPNPDPPLTHTVTVFAKIELLHHLVTGKYATKK